MSDKSLVSLPREIQVQLDGQVVIVRKLGIGKYIQLTGVFEALIGKVVGSLDQFKSDADFIQKLPSMIMQSIPEAVAFVSVATGLDITYLNDNVGLDEFLALIEAIFKVNDMAKVVAILKNLLATLNVKKTTA